MPADKPARKPRTWESVYRAALRRGDDPAYALYLAEEWQKRQEAKRRKEANDGGR